MLGIPIPVPNCRYTDPILNRYSDPFLNRYTDTDTEIKPSYRYRYRLSHCRIDTSIVLTYHTNKLNSQLNTSTDQNTGHWTVSQKTSHWPSGFSPAGSRKSVAGVHLYWQAGFVGKKGQKYIRTNCCPSWEIRSKIFLLCSYECNKPRVKIRFYQRVIPT